MPPPLWRVSTPRRAPELEGLWGPGAVGVRGFLRGSLPPLSGARVSMPRRAPGAAGIVKPGASESSVDVGAEGLIGAPEWGTEGPPEPEGLWAEGLIGAPEWGVL